MHRACQDLQADGLDDSGVSDSPGQGSKHNDYMERRISALKMKENAAKYKSTAMLHIDKMD